VDVAEHVRRLGQLRPLLRGRGDLSTSRPDGQPGVAALAARLEGADRDGTAPHVVVPVHFGAAVRSGGDRRLARRHGFRVGGGCGPCPRRDVRGPAGGRLPVQRLRVFSFSRGQDRTTARRVVTTTATTWRPACAACARTASPGPGGPVRPAGGTVVVRTGRARLPLPDDRPPGALGGSQLERLPSFCGAGASSPRGTTACSPACPCTGRSAAPTGSRAGTCIQSFSTPALPAVAVRCSRRCAGPGSA